MRLLLSHGACMEPRVIVRVALMTLCSSVCEVVPKQYAVHVDDCVTKSHSQRHKGACPELTAAKLTQHPYIAWRPDAAANLETGVFWLDINAVRAAAANKTVTSTLCTMKPLCSGKQQTSKHDPQNMCQSNTARRQAATTCQKQSAVSTNDHAFDAVKDMMAAIRQADTTASSGCTSAVLCKAVDRLSAAPLQSKHQEQSTRPQQDQLTASVPTSPNVSAISARQPQLPHLVVFDTNVLLDREGLMLVTDWARVAIKQGSSRVQLLMPQVQVTICDGNMVPVCYFGCVWFPASVT